jgi:hypothetical protein
MKKSFIIPIIILVILALGFLGWQSLAKKSAEGGSCKSDNNCQTGLRCINNICSSGKAGSVCVNKTDCLTPFCVEGKCAEGKRGDSCITKVDCLTNYCVNGKCTEGKKDDTCSTYKDCEKGLFCKKEVCSEPPSYSQYFNKIVVSKMKVGMPPGPNNIPVPTTEFKTTDAIEIDLVGVKQTTIGEFYYEAVDQVTGEVVFTTSGYKQKLEGRDTGTGSDLPRILGKGEFDLNIYYNDEMVYTTTIKISE